MPNLLYCVGHALAQQGLGDIAVAVADPFGLGVANLLGKVGGAAWKEWRADAKQDKLHADILAAAQLEFAEAKVLAAQVAAQVAPDNPELAGQVERFVTLVPASIRASLRRPDDPTGTTLPADYAVEDADDFVRLLPPRLPRFKPGDAPDWLGGWELVRQLGAGGFGEVWQARNAEDHTLVGAVKFGHALTDTEHALLNEGDVLNRIRGQGGHPGIVELLDRRTRNVAVPWLRYEYVPGGDLCGLIHRWQGRPPADRLPVALAAFRDLCRTVGHFHRLEGGPVVHRDLKPSNILVAADGRLKVADFGIGAVSARRALEAERQGTMSRSMVLHSYLRGSHTPLYASPQQKKGSKVIDPRDDVHALGVIAYQILTGRLDQGAGHDFADDLRDCGATERLVALLSKCVKREVERRPRDAQELADELGEFLEDGVVTLTPASPKQELLPVSPPATPVSVAKTYKPMPQVAPGLARPGSQVVEVRRLAGHSNYVYGVAFSPDGRLVATASADSTARLWDAATGQEVRTLTTNTCGLYGVAFSPDGRLVATASDDSTARLWDAATGREVRTLRGHESRVCGVAFSPDGRLVATASNDSTARLWDAATGQEVRTLAGHVSWLRWVTFSPDGRLVATASDDSTARLWDAATGQEVRRLAGHSNYVYGVAFSPDGRLVATASADSTARLWDAATGQEVRTLAEHGAAVFGVAFSPDGRIVATARADSRAKLWDTATGQEVQTLAGLSSGVHGVAFSPDGRLVATASSDHTTKLWLLTTAGEKCDYAPVAVTQPPRPDVRLAKSGDGIAYPGDHLWLHATVANPGKGDLSQLWAEVRSDNPTLARWQTTLGRVQPGETAERCLAAVLPADTPAGELRGELVFHEGNGYPLPARPVVWTVRPFPRLDFATRIRPVNDGSGGSHGRGDGRPRRGEYVDLAVSVTNATGEGFDHLFVTLAAAEVPAGTRVTAPRGEVGELADGATADARVGFACGGTAGVARFTVRVESADGRTLAVEAVELAIE